MRFLCLLFACALQLLLALANEGSVHKASQEQAKLSQGSVTKAQAHEQHHSPPRLLATVLDSELPQQRPRPLRVSVEQQRVAALDGPGRSLLSSATNATVELLKAHFQVRHPPPDGLLGYPPCSESKGDSIGKPTNCTSYNSQPKCGAATIQPSHLADPATCETSSSGGLKCRSFAGGQGQDTDLYLYLTSVQEDTCNGGAVAWALPCVLDMRTNRPIIATVNMCPEALMSSSNDGDENSTPDKAIALLAHEVIHALGFSNSMFSLFVEPNTLEELGVANVAKKVDVGGREVTAIVTPTVRREAQQQFGCAQLEGANLEDEGGSGSANAHWEFTEYQGDLMLAQRSVASGDDPVISRVTMALLEDTGWYLANWTAAGGPLPFAYNTGCTLPMQGCQAMLEQQQQQQNPDLSSSSSFLFCSPNQESAQDTRCTTSLRALGQQCKSDPTFSNGCGMVVAEAPSCTLPDRQYPNPLAFGWKHTPQSRCFDIMLEFQASSTNNQSLGTFTFPEGGETQEGRSAACFPSRCNEAGHHFVIVLDRELRCSTGAVLNLPELIPDVYQEGSIGPCPNEAEACQKTLSCGKCSRLGGICTFGSCRCKLGWQGADCSHSLMGVVPLSERQPFAEGMWFETLEVSLRLQTEGSKGSAREQGALLGVWTQWSGQPERYVKVAKLEQQQQQQQSDMQARGVLSERGLVEGPQQVQMMLHAQQGRRLQAQGAVLGRSGGRGLLPDLQERASGLSEEVKQVTELQVVFHTRPTPEEQISLSGRLASTSAVQQLSDKLKAAGFKLTMDTISQRLAVLMDKAVELEGDGGSNTAEQDGFGTEEKIITGVVVGVGGLLLLLLIPLGLLWWVRSGVCLHPHLANTKDRDTSEHGSHDGLDGKDVTEPRAASVPLMGPPTGRILYNPLNRRWFSEFQIHDDTDQQPTKARPPQPLRQSGISVAVPSSPSSASHAATTFQQPRNACASLITPHAPSQQAPRAPRSDGRPSALTRSIQGQTLPPALSSYPVRPDPPAPDMDLPSISPVASPQGSFTGEVPLPTVPSLHSATGEQQLWRHHQQSLLASWMSQRATERNLGSEAQAEAPTRAPSRFRMATTPYIPPAAEFTDDMLQHAHSTPAPCQAQLYQAQPSAAPRSHAWPSQAQPWQEQAHSPSAVAATLPRARQPGSSESTPAKERGDSFAFSYSPSRRPRAGRSWASANQVTPVHGSVTSPHRLQVSTQLHNSTGGVHQAPLSPPPAAKARASAPQVLDDEKSSSSHFQFAYSPSPRKVAGSRPSFLQHVASTTLGALTPTKKSPSPRASQRDVGTRRAATPPPEGTAAYQF